MAYISFKGIDKNKKTNFIYQEIEVMKPNEEFPTIKHIEINYIIFLEQLSVNITKIYSQNINQIWKNPGRLLKWL